jgi:DNA-binding NtrC family response regulator
MRIAARKSNLFQGELHMLPVSVASAHPISPLSAPMVSSRSRSKVVLIASSDASLRERLGKLLTGLRWQVLEAPGGAEAWLASQAATPHLEAMVIDAWLPDLEVNEFLKEFRRDHPLVDLMMTDGTTVQDCARSPYRQELLYALRRSQDVDTAAWRTAPDFEGSYDPAELPKLAPRESAMTSHIAGPAIAGPAKAGPAFASMAAANPDQGFPASSAHSYVGRHGHEAAEGLTRELTNDMTADLTMGGSGVARSFPSIDTSSLIHVRREAPSVERIPELIGSSAVMMEVSRRIRLVAARSTPVLIEGPTGSGKELVAEALHRLSLRSRKPFVAINCAAIPEALLEAELFGHTRGAFTGAVQGRTGRIESAEGGTLFLDEIGEVPLSLQSKLLRFFESGELQRIGDNETVKVDVRIVAATHQPLAEKAQKGLFRADLYYRLAVFLIRTPSLAEHMEDLPKLVGHFLERMGRTSPVKRIDSGAMATLAAHGWPGNVRELEHVLERAAILAGDEPVISASEIDFGLVPVN